MRALFFVGALLSSLLETASACTTLVVGKKASADGSVMVTHSDDGESGEDSRLCFVPAKDHPKGSQRPMYFGGGYPRHIGTDRGACYLPKEHEKPFDPIGYVPQVNHTFGYFEAGYGMLNEKGVGMGESTCSGLFFAKAMGHGGKALFGIDELTRVGLERAATARGAIKIMGALAEKHGFYGEDGSFEGGSESLMVGDSEEAFMFHILADPTGESAIWVARRVPDDEVGVVANMFVIREVHFDDPQNFLFSDSVRTVAQERGWWQPGQLFDFTRIYSDGEYAHKFYSGRRMWSAYRLFGNDFSDEYENLRYNVTYPVTAKPSKLVSHRDLFKIHRDHYEGTKHDMTKGLAAGPWGDPDRWVSSDVETVEGSWERSIGIYRSDQTHVVQARKVDTGVGSVLWYGPHCADATVFLPVPQSATKVPKPYTIANPDVLSRDSVYWAHRYVFNVAKIKFSYAMEDVRGKRDVLEDAGARLLAALDKKAVAGTLDPEEVNQNMSSLAKKILTTWWELPDFIVAKYADGWLNDGDAMGYPDWWLKAVGYGDGPPPPPPAVSPSGLSMPPSGSVVGVLERCVRACPAGEGFVPCLQSCQNRMDGPIAFFAQV